MTSQLKIISQPVEKELQEFEDYFRNVMKSNIFILDKILTFILKRKGKQIRPLFVLLSSGINGNINEKTYRVAALIELLHSATLIHDDVVDDSFERRGAFSINALWKNKISVLTGDYLLSRGMLLALTNNDYDLLSITSNAVKLMSEGELLQIQKARTLDIREEVYYQVIRMKTASLFATSCSAGAASAGTSDEYIKKMWEFGINLGMAFQIKDDLLDFKPEKSGKPKGTDVKEKKMTLPLIYSLQKSTSGKKRQIINLMAHPKKDNSSFDKIVAFIDSMKGFDYATRVMTEYRDKALLELDAFPGSDYKSSLVGLTDYVIARDK